MKHISIKANVYANSITLNYMMGNFCMFNFDVNTNTATMTTVAPKYAGGAEQTVTKEYNLAPSKQQAYGIFQELRAKAESTYIDLKIERIEEQLKRAKNIQNEYSPSLEDQGFYPKTTAETPSEEEYMAKLNHNYDRAYKAKINPFIHL